MAINSRILLLSIVVFFAVFSFSHELENSSFRIKAVNLGGWLVTEGWIKPSLFDGIPNKDLLDGTGVQFKSVTIGKYLCAETGGGTIIVANRTAASGWETFSLWRINETTFQLRVFNKQFVGLCTNGNVVAVSTTPGKSETFVIVRKSDDLNRVRIKAPNGFFLQGRGGPWFMSGDGGLLGGVLPSLMVEEESFVYFMGQTWSHITEASRVNDWAFCNWRFKCFPGLRMKATQSEVDVNGRRFRWISHGEHSQMDWVMGHWVKIWSVVSTWALHKWHVVSMDEIRAAKAKTEELVTADFAGTSEWGDNDPSVFVLSTAGGLQGEFQVTNGYGPLRAPQIMKME
uniref:DUF7910 domain-containing protein n=1 Tax=Fagus sylvatica TaxID=28930 RepID=A0A2N9ECL6_FAGSY